MLDYDLHRILGAGKARVVWSVRNRKDIVVKVAHRTNDGFANRLEWEIWNKADKKLKKLLVPCVSIHEDGLFLIMERGHRTSEVGDYPSFIKDAKKGSNWVYHNDVLKLCDYADQGIADHLNISYPKSIWVKK